MEKIERLISQALKMSPAEKVELIEQLLQSLDKPDEQIDKLWQKEAESRIDAYDSGKIRTVALRELMEKYKSD